MTVICELHQKLAGTYSAQLQKKNKQSEHMNNSTYAKLIRNHEKKTSSSITVRPHILHKVTIYLLQDQLQLSRFLYWASFLQNTIVPMTHDAMPTSQIIQTNQQPGVEPLRQQATSAGSCRTIQRAPATPVHHSSTRLPESMQIEHLKKKKTKVIHPISCSSAGS